MTSQRVEEAVDRLRARPKPDNPDITTLIDWYDYAVATIDQIEHIAEQRDQLREVAKWALPLVGSLPLEMEPTRVRMIRQVKANT